jgi:NADP-dependent 3-hydroxy acid dehydrogenase YdfG
MPSVAIHPGATIFVTGVNGLVGSHVADQLLKKGYNVRGAVRDVEKCKWLSEYFEGQYKNAKFELVAVPDMTVEGCYDEVVKGMPYFLAKIIPGYVINADVAITLCRYRGFRSRRCPHVR